MIEKTFTWRDRFEPHEMITGKFYFDMTVQEFQDMEEEHIAEGGFIKWLEDGLTDPTKRWSTSKTLIQASFGIRRGHEFDKVSDEALYQQKMFLKSPAFEELVIEWFDAPEPEIAFTDFFKGVFGDAVRRLEQTKLADDEMKKNVSEAWQETKLPEYAQTPSVREDLTKMTEEKTISMEELKDLSPGELNAKMAQGYKVV